MQHISARPAFQRHSGLLLTFRIGRMLKACGEMALAKFLQDVLVLDFSRVLAGPFCTMTLADLGARVIKVEPPGGDEARGMGPFVNGCSLYFASVNRDKEGIALNLKHPAGMDIARRLAAKADVLVENFRPGAMDRLGLGYEAVRHLNSSIIYTSLSGFGQEGPYSDRGAYDIVIQAMSGLMGITGSPESGPTRVGASIGDLIPALYAVAGVLAALHRREITGEGCHIDLAMFDATVAVIENALVRYSATGKDPELLGNRHPAITPFSAFATADSQVVIACGNDTLWLRLCAAIDAPGLAADARFVSNALRTENVQALTKSLEEALRKRTTAEWLDKLLAAGIPCAKVNKISDLINDPSLRSRKMIVDLEHPLIGSMPVPGMPIKAKGLDDTVGRPAPDYGSATASVLAELLQLDKAEIIRLGEAGAIEGVLDVN